MAEYIYQEGTRHNKRVGGFGGGKNHMVFTECDIDSIFISKLVIKQHI